MTKNLHSFFPVPHIFNPEGLSRKGGGGGGGGGVGGYFKYILVKVHEINNRTF